MDVLILIQICVSIATRLVVAMARGVATTIMVGETVTECTMGLEGVCLYPNTPVHMDRGEGTTDRTPTGLKTRLRGI